MTISQLQYNTLCTACFTTTMSILNDAVIDTVPSNPADPLGEKGFFLSDPTIWLPILSAVFLAIVGWSLKVFVWDKFVKSRRLKLELRSCLASKFEPASIVRNYDARGVIRYLAIAADKKIKESFGRGESIAIIGEKGIGKSHTVANLIASTGNWNVIRPRLSLLSHYNELSLRKRRHLLLLDDLEAYLADSDGPRLSGMIEWVMDRSKQFRLIITCRDENSLDRLQAAVAPRVVIQLQKWSSTMGAELRKLTGVESSDFDGTPLSCKAPPRIKRQDYDKLEPVAQSVLKALALLQQYGVATASPSALRAIFTSQVFAGADHQFQSALQAVRCAEFLYPSVRDIVAYDSKLSDMVGNQKKNVSLEAIQEILLNAAAEEELDQVGKYCLDRHEVRNAKETYSLMLRNDIRCELAHYRLGRIAEREEQWKSAAEHLEAAARLKPNWASPLFRLRVVYRKTGQLGLADDADKRLRKTTKRHDFSFWPDYQELRQSKKWEAALELLDDVLRDNVATWEVHFLRGGVLTDLGRNEEAILAFNKAIAINEKKSDAYFGLARPLRNMKRSEEAETALRKAMSLNPEVREMYSQLAQLLSERGLQEEAEEQLNVAVEKWPNDAELWSFLGELLAERGRWSQMAHACRKAVELRPQYPEAHVGLAFALRESGEIEGAIAENQKAIELGERSAAPHYGLGRCLCMIDRYADALAAFDKALEIDGGHSAAHYYRGRALIELEMFEDARRALSNAEEFGFNPGELRHGKRLLTERQALRNDA